MEKLIPIVSDRRGFEDPDNLSEHTHHRIVDIETKKSQAISIEKLYAEIAGKNVLILIHGYNSDFSEAISMFKPYIANLENSYDVIVGYLWPGGDQGAEYFLAKNRVVHQIDLRLLSFLTSLSAISESIDILAHSMGCRLCVEALDLASGKLVRNLFLTGPAIDNEALEKNERYYKATRNAENIFAFHSHRDRVLGIYYLVSEFDAALGHGGPENPERLAQNVTIIDVGSEVPSHSDYRNSQMIIEKVKESIEVKQTAAVSSPTV